MLSKHGLNSNHSVGWSFQKKKVCIWIIYFMKHQRHLRLIFLNSRTGFVIIKMVLAGLIKSSISDAVKIMMHFFRHLYRVVYQKIVSNINKPDLIWFCCIWYEFTFTHDSTKYEYVDKLPFIWRVVCRKRVVCRRREFKYQSSFQCVD